MLSEGIVEGEFKEAKAWEERCIDFEDDDTGSVET